jgi:hypothetical protein
MTDANPTSRPSAAAPPHGQRREWNPPRLTTIRAGEAENSPTGVSSDGAFSSGS